MVRERSWSSCNWGDWDGRIRRQQCAQRCGLSPPSGHSHCCQARSWCLGGLAFAQFAEQTPEGRPGGLQLALVLPFGAHGPIRMGFWWLCSQGQLTSRLSISVPVRWQRRTLCSGLCGPGFSKLWFWTTQLVLESSNLVGACVWRGWSEAVLAQLRDHPSL